MSQTKTQQLYKLYIKSVFLRNLKIPSVSVGQQYHEWQAYAS